MTHGGPVEQSGQRRAPSVARTYVLVERPVPDQGPSRDARGSGLEVQPAGILTVLGAAAVTVRTLISALTPRWLTVQVRWMPMRRPRSHPFLLTLLVVLEVRQQLRADLLLAGT